jgi:DNA-binding transcriptional regulator YiaG
MLRDRATNHVVYGHRIYEARVNVMMSRQTLALLLNVKEEVVAGWEEGEYQPLGGDLDRLVEIFNQPRPFYFKKPVEHFDPDRIFFKVRDDDDA